ncbi:MAG: hypothetical protein ACTSU4_12685 [Promethearchaeota archaeon]
MVKALQDIWILTDTGTTLFSRVFHEKLPDQFFGALMSALNKFAEEIDKGGLSHFQMRSKQFSILKQENLLFVASSDPKKVSEKKALNELKKIAAIFFKEYGEIIKNWDNDISVFEGFDKKIEESLEGVLKKFQKTFW